MSAAFAKMAVAQQQTQVTSGKQTFHAGETGRNVMPWINQQVFGYLPGVKVELVAKTKDVVRSDTGITIQPSKTFADCDLREKFRPFRSRAIRG